MTMETFIKTSAERLCLEGEILMNPSMDPDKFLEEKVQQFAEDFPALRSDFERAWALFNLGNLYSSFCMYPEAIVCYEKTLEIASHFGPPSVFKNPPSRAYECLRKELEDFGLKDKEIPEAIKERVGEAEARLSFLYVTE